MSQEELSRDDLQATGAPTDRCDRLYKDDSRWLADLHGVAVRVSPDLCHTLQINQHVMGVGGGEHHNVGLPHVAVHQASAMEPLQRARYIRHQLPNLLSGMTDYNYSVTKKTE